MPKQRRGSWIPWLPARACAVDHVVSSSHGSTVDRLHNSKGYVIWAIHARSKGSGRLHATGGGEHAGVRRRAVEGSPARACLAAQDAKTCARALHEARKHASKPRGSGEWRGHPQRPVSEGAGRPRRRAREAA
jgi:hypothetical protein